MDLHTLCIQGNTQGVIERCKLSPLSINDLVYGKPALWHAAMRGHKDVVRAMVILGADVNIKDVNNGETALHVACHMGFLDIAMIIVSRNKEAAHIRSCTDAAAPVEHPPLHHHHYRYRRDACAVAFSSSH